MEIDRKAYDPSVHEIYRALVLPQPLADSLTRSVYMGGDGVFHAEAEYVHRHKGTRYRGDVLVCSSSFPAVPGRYCGVTCGLVELYDVVPAEGYAFSGEGLHPTTGFVWLLRNPRRVVEMPVKGRKGFYDMVLMKGDVTEYPRYVKLGSDGYKMVTGR